MSNSGSSMPLEFKLRLQAAKAAVAAARLTGSKLVLANALKELGNIERRPPHLREDANRTFAEARDLYLELNMQLEAAWVIRHLGINQEYAELLAEAERYYDESLALFRAHAITNTLDFANTVRYPAVVKNRLGKRSESKDLWEEAIGRYSDLDCPAGVAEGSAWLAIFAIDDGDLEDAAKWLAKAESAANAAADHDTYIWVNQVRERLEDAEKSCKH